MMWTGSVTLPEKQGGEENAALPSAFRFFASLHFSDGE